MHASVDDIGSPHSPLVPTHCAIGPVHEVLCQHLGQGSARSGDGELVPALNGFILGLERTQRGGMSDVSVRRHRQACRTRMGMLSNSWVEKVDLP